MTPEELRVGLRRLVVVIAFLLVLAIFVSWAFVLLGATSRSGTSAGFGAVGVLLVLGGAAGSTRSQSLRRAGDLIVVKSRAERRESNFTFGGLLALGVCFCAASLEIF